MKKNIMIITSIMVIILVIFTIFITYYIQNGKIQEEPSEKGFACTMDYNPVCGVNGITYGNKCMAQETQIAYIGECTKDNSNADTPKICTREYMPVCGVNNVTYGNKCMADLIEIAYLGECK